MSVAPEILANAALAAVPAAGFGMLFNVPFAMLGWCAMAVGVAVPGLLVFRRRPVV
jgi:hypothetical protein